jgi:N-acetylneuraminic acid mutarotase
MSQTTLPVPHTTPAPRRRVVLGLFDADGWPWAGAKALFWFVVIIVLLGYLPDRAYYFTVGRTVELWPVAIELPRTTTPLFKWSVVNFCPPENETLPCPAPAGATLPWHPAPEQVRLPAARTDGVAAALGSAYVYVGGSDGTAATSTVYVSHPVGTGNIDAWSEGPSLPEPRADAATIAFGNTLLVMGGLDASGAPTDTVFGMEVSNEGTLGEWEALDDVVLPEPLAGASAVTVSDGIVLMGGEGEDGLTSRVWKSQVNAAGTLQAWKEQAPLLEENADGGAVHVGDVIFLVGGRNASGPVATVQQGLVGGDEEHPAPETDPNAIFAPWRVSTQTNLPEPRTNVTVFTANGNVYAVGGNDGTAQRTETWWATPDAEGTIPAWNHLVEMDLGEGIEGSASFLAGPHAFIVGGTTAGGVTADIARAYLAPQEPFFQAGILGVTIPGLQLGGEIGQQIGYLNAAGVGTVNFILLLLIGYAYAHPQKVRDLRDRLRRRRE